MAAILVIAALLRLYRLLDMFPVLVDESIYMRWAEIIDHQGQWFISLLDGKQPLTYWLLAAARKLWEGDPLLQARLISVLAGLLTTLGIFSIGRRLGGETAGLISAFLYACFPYALLYDRLAYTEAFVNLAGVAIVLSSIECFHRSSRSWMPELAAGLALGLGLFTKQTVLLFAFFPALAGVWWGRGAERPLIPRLGVIYGIAAVFVGIGLVSVPDAPLLETHDALLHHTAFFVQPADLLANPLRMVPSNAAKLADYIGTYMSWPAALAALASLLFLARGGLHDIWILVSVSILPLMVQVFVLELMFPTRYPFPHFWPWLVVLGVAAPRIWERLVPRGRQKISAPGLRIALLAALPIAVAGPMLYQSAGMLLAPRRFLHQEEITRFLGSGAHAGFGIREAAAYLIEESRQGGFVLLTDPIWGPPADAMFPYLNQRYGIRVYEAHWMQRSGDHFILPPGQAVVVKSHYERVAAGRVDFSKIRRVFYVTDTNYNSQAAVAVRQPGAKLVASFPKPNRKDSIDLYRLK